MFSSPKDLGARRDAPMAHKARVWRASLFDLFMRRVLAATAAEFLKLQPVCRRLAVLRRRVIPFFALTTL
jgi:hypothetical protein